MRRLSFHSITAFLFFSFAALGAFAGGGGSSPPSIRAASLSFNDNDGYSGKIGGPVVIGKASDETNITSYVLRWGLAGGCNAANSFIAEIPKTGANITWQMPTGTSIPGAVYELLVYTKNAAGEMATCQGTRVAINDRVAPKPQHLAKKVFYHFTAPANPSDIFAVTKAESVEIIPAADESDITHYAVYWGDAAGHRLGGDLAPLLGRVAATKDGKTLRYDFPPNLTVEIGAIYLLVCSENYGQQYCGENFDIPGRTLDLIRKSDLLGLLSTVNGVKDSINNATEASCPGIKVMETCGNHVCDGIETAANCPADCTAYNVASFNYQTLCNQVQNVYHPTSVAEIQTIVNNAVAGGKHVKVIGGAGPGGTTGSASNVVCTDGVVIAMDQITLDNPNFSAALETFEGKAVVNVPAGTRMSTLGDWLYARGRSLGYTHLGWADVSVGGALGTSAHGSSPTHSNVLSQRVAALEIVKPNGQVAWYSEGTTGVTDPDLWKAMTTHLGYFGVITRARLKTEDAKNLRVYVTHYDESEILDSPKGVFGEIADCDFGQFNWFPHLNKIMKTCGYETTKAAEAGANNRLLYPFVDFSQISAQQTVQAYQLGACQPNNGIHGDMEFLRLNGWYLTPPLIKTVDGTMRYSTDSTGPRHLMTSSPLIDVGRDVFQMDWEVAVPASNLQAAMQYIKSVTNGANVKGRELAAPLIGIFVRFSKSENNALMAYTGTGGPFQDNTYVVHIEIPVFVPVALNQAQFDDYMEPYEDAMKVLISQYGARAHWGKTSYGGNSELFDLQKTVGSYAYDNRLQRFSQKVGQFDPTGVFANPFAKTIGIVYPNFTYPSSW